MDLSSFTKSHRCSILVSQVEKGDSEIESIEYNPNSKEWIAFGEEVGNVGYTIAVFSYCPFCGESLPFSGVQLDAKESGGTQPKEA